MEKRKINAKKLSSGLSRRDLIRGSAAAVAMTVVPAHVLGGPGRTAPSEKLNIAGIGVGGQGSWDLDNVSSENIVVLCDVDWQRAADTFKRYPKAKRYRDFRINAGERETRRCRRGGDAGPYSRRRDDDGRQNWESTSIAKSR